MDEFKNNQSDAAEARDANAEDELSFGAGGPGMSGKEAFVPASARTNLNPSAIPGMGKDDCTELNSYVQQLSVIAGKRCHETSGTPELKKSEPMHYMAATDDMTRRIEALISELSGLAADVSSIAADIASAEGITIS